MKRTALVLAAALLALVLSTATPAPAAPQVATIQVKGMVCSA